MGYRIFPVLQKYPCSRSAESNYTLRRKLGGTFGAIIMNFHLKSKQSSQDLWNRKSLIYQCNSLFAPSRRILKRHQLVLSDEHSCFSAFIASRYTRRLTAEDRFIFRLGFHSRQANDHTASSVTRFLQSSSAFWSMGEPAFS
jgi:hypothetical protein